MPLVPLLSADAAGCSARHRRPGPDCERRALVIFQEHDASAKLRTACILIHLRDQFLAALILWMGLSGKQKLNRTILIIQDRAEPFNVSEDERATLVGGEPARETDSQCLGVKNFLGGQDVRTRGSDAFPLNLKTSARECDQPLSTALVRSPQLRSMCSVRAQTSNAVGLSCQADQGSGRRECRFPCDPRLSIKLFVIDVITRFLTPGKITSFGKSCSCFTPLETLTRIAARSSRSFRHRCWRFRPSARIWSSFILHEFAEVRSIICGECITPAGTGVVRGEDRSRLHFHGRAEFSPFS